MNKKLLFILCAGLLSLPGISQGVQISPTPGTPDPSAILDISSTNQGFLTPRMTTTQRNAIVSPAIGLEIYNTTTSCKQIYMPLSGWRDVVCDCPSPPSSNFSFSPLSPGMGGNVTFTPQVPGMNYSWTFQSGNPGSSNAQNPVVSWANAGTYQITLTVTDQLGCFTTFTASITVVNCPPGSQTFNYTGAMQSFTVPNCATQIQVQVSGAEGGQGFFSTNQPGKGGFVSGSLTVTPGASLSVLVGGKGANSVSSNGGGGGGGLSAILQSGTPLVVAGGGGGAASGGSSTAGGNGGNGGGTSGGGDGGSIVCSSGVVNGGNGGTGTGTGGTSQNYAQAGNGGAGFGGYGRGPSGPSSGSGTAYGAGGTSGSQGGAGGFGGGGCGGNYSNNGWGSGGGGGGGFAGGGGGNCEGNCNRGGGGGGGGTSLISNLTNAVETPGSQSGNGQVIISW